MKSLTAGSLAGLVATVPMTQVMDAIEKVNERKRKPRPLPPYEITEEALERGLDQKIPEEKVVWATLLLHFGFGAAAGAAYGLIAPRVRARGWLKGPLYGLGVWASSYAGWLPPSRLQPPVTRQPRGRNVTMVAAHLVWGAVLGGLVDSFSAKATKDKRS
jgi:uncharacterized membrane protein YagU involved in acid resistance